METTPPQVLALLLGVVGALTGRSLAVQPTVGATQSIAQQLASNNMSLYELSSSLVVNQMLLLRMLNESSTTCSILERDRESLRDMKHQLNATGQVLEELQDAKEAAMSELNTKHKQAKEEFSGLKDAATSEMQTWNEEMKKWAQRLKADAMADLDIKIAVELERVQDSISDGLEDINEKEGQLETQLITLKESVVNEVMTAKQKIHQELNVAREETLAKFKKATMTSHIYQLHNGSITHDEAMAACEKLGGRLALPKNAEQNAQLYRLVRRHYSGSGRYWIGIDDKREEGRWIDSVTGQVLNYTNFRGNLPDNYGGNEHCGEIRSSWDMWNDSLCESAGAGYLCEFTVATIYA